ncbi:MAG: gliding motility protein GldC [Bacteroidetes bacterium]|nr:MAG: gliding motility protein GldC [Bacteroidota bacterium]
MQQSTIKIDVTLDKDRIPQRISWNADGSSAQEPQEAKAMMVSFWDGKEKSALRIDLWTKEMMVDEMGDFYYQTLMTMAEAYNRATHQKELVDDLKNFAKVFYQKSREALEK